MPTDPLQHSAVNQLRRQLAGERPGKFSPARPVWSTGLPPLDELLPGGGVRSGSIVEWLGTGEGSGASTLAWLMARRMQQASRSVVVVDPLREFFPPGADQLGVHLDRVILVQPASRREALWALEQALRSQAGCVTLGRFDQWPPQVFRRLKLAAERGGGVGLFLRAARFRAQPCWADVRLIVQPQPTNPGHPREGHFARQLRLKVLFVRGGGFEELSTVMSIDDEAHSVCVDSELARATVAGPAARAS